MSRARLLRRLAVVFALICTLLVAWQLFSAPTTLMVAVGPSESSQYQFVHASARALKETGQNLRLKIVVEKDSAAAGKALDGRKVDLAVLRSDDDASIEGRSLAVIHTRSILIVTRKGSGITSIGELKGRSTAIVNNSAESNRGIIDRILQHYGLASSELNLEEIGARELSQTAPRHEAYIIIADAALGGPKAVLQAIAGDNRENLNFIGMPAAEGLALRFREFQKSTIPVGAFGGTPPIPAEVINTVAITYELAATDDLPQTTATDLLETLIDLRTRLRRYLPRTPFDIEAPPVDEARRFLPHTGAVAYSNDEEPETFLETYSDQIWLALFGLSIIGSSITGFLGWAGVFDSKPENNDAAERLRALAERIGTIGDPAGLEAAQRELDETVIALLRKYDQSPSSSANGDPSLAVWIASLNAIIDRRRAQSSSSA
jgi:TRAP-type uncharacterized transport system substrate-binding protein